MDMEKSTSWQHTLTPKMLSRLVEPNPHKPNATSSVTTDTDFLLGVAILLPTVDGHGRSLDVFRMMINIIAFSGDFLEVLTPGVTTIRKWLLILVGRMCPLSYQVNRHAISNSIGMAIAKI